MIEIQALIRVPKFRRRLHIPESLRVSLLLVALLCLYFWPAIFGGRVLAPTDMIFQYSFFKGAAPASYSHPSNPILSDPVLKFYPWLVATREAFHNGQFPFWNPYIYAGAPLFANGESAILYPVNLLGLLLPLHMALTFSAITRMFIAGLGTFLYLRAIRVGQLGAVVGAITFMFGGSMVVWLNYPVANAYAWMPMLFFLGERLIASRRLMFVALISVVIAVQILGGHYQTSFIILVAWWPYCLYRLLQEHRTIIDRWQSTKLLGLLIVSTVVGLMLVAAQIIPFWEWLRQGNEVQQRLQERSFSLIYPLFWRDVVDIVTFALPNLFGNPTWGSPISFFYSNYIEQMGYMGIVPLALAIMAVLTGWMNSRPAARLGQRDARKEIYYQPTLFLACLGSFFLFVAIRLPVFDLVNHLPVFNLVATPRYRLVFTFCVAILAAIGVEQIFTFALNSQGIRRLIHGLLWFVGVSSILLVGVHFALINLKDWLLTFNRIQHLYPILESAFSVSRISMYYPILVALAFVCVLLLYRRGYLHKQQSMALIVVLIAMDLFVFGSDFNPIIPENQIFPETETVRVLHNRLASAGIDRVVGMYDDLPPDTGMPYHFYEAAGVDFPLRRYAEFAQAAGGTLPDHFRVRFAQLQPKLISLMNVRYIISWTEPENMPKQQIKRIYQDDAVGIYENLGALPRAYVVHDVLVINEDRQILNTLASASFDPRHTIIVEQPLPKPLSGSAPGADDSATIVRYQPQDVAIEANMTEPGFLFLSDTYYPGWKVLVDGEESQIYRANYTFRAVMLSKGQHKVEFIYAPSGLFLGMAITLIGFFSVLICVFLDIYPFVRMW